MANSRPRPSQEGAALILTLLVLAILVVLVVQLTFSVKVEESVVQNSEDDAAMELAARGAIPLAEALFQDDRQNGVPAGDLDTLADILFDPKTAEQRTFKVGDVSLTIEAEDLERRLPLAWLADEGRREFMELALKRLIEKLKPVEGDPEALAKAISEKVQALASEGSDPSAPAPPPSGAPAPGAPGAAEAPPRRFLFSLEQLLDAPAEGESADPSAAGGAGGGVDKRLLWGDPEADPPTQGIGPFVTTWPVGAINLNTVLPEVLFAVLPEKDKAKEPKSIWEVADEVVEAVRKRRIDPDHMGGGAAPPADGEPAGGGASGGSGDQGASRSWSGQPFKEVKELQDAAIHERLKEIFTAAKEGDGSAPGGEPTPTPTGGGGAGQPGEPAPFGLEQALGVKSQLYALRVTAEVGGDLSGLGGSEADASAVKGVYRLIVHRSGKDVASALSFEEVAQ